jgi:hypothetical protein
MRPSLTLFIILITLLLADGGLYIHMRHLHTQSRKSIQILDITTSALGLSDLCVSTEARYTRHPAVSDPMAPFMDHPGAIEHFPTGSFWLPPNYEIFIKNHFSKNEAQ